jgi:hypothetical protein
MPSTAHIASMRLPTLLGLLLPLLLPAQAIKLRFRYEECLYHEFEMYTPFYGSFVALSDIYGMQVT